MKYKGRGCVYAKDDKERTRSVGFLFEFCDRKEELQCSVQSVFS